MCYFNHTLHVVEVPQVELVDFALRRLVDQCPAVQRDRAAPVCTLEERSGPGPRTWALSSYYPEPKQQALCVDGQVEIESATGLRVRVRVVRHEAGSCLASSTRAFGDAVSVEYCSERECAAPVLERALANATIYRQVFVWAHDKDVREWTYDPEAPNATLLSRFAFSEAEKAALACVGVRYRAAIELPEPLLTFVRLLHIELEIDVAIEKQVCRNGNVLVEHVRVEAPLVDEVEISTRSEAGDGLLRSTSRVHFRVPWYATALEGEIAAALRRMVGEILDAVVKTLYVAPEDGTVRQLLGASAHEFDHRDSRHAIDQRQDAFDHRDSRHAFATQRRLPQRDAHGFRLNPSVRNACLERELTTNKTAGGSVRRRRSSRPRRRR